MKRSFKPLQGSLIGISGFLVVLLFGFCEHETKSKKPENENNDQVPISGYDLKHPSQSWKLPEQLKEISGIVKLGGDSLLAIEDLHANLYFLKLQNSSAAILANLPFAETEKDKFDIEDVAMIGDTVYALWSHASVFKIWNWRSKIQSKEYSTRRIWSRSPRVASCASSERGNSFPTNGSQRLLKKYVLNVTSEKS